METELAIMLFGIGGLFVILEIVFLILKKYHKGLFSSVYSFRDFMFENLKLFAFSIVFGVFLLLILVATKILLITFGIIASVILFKYLIYRIFWRKK